MKDKILEALENFNLGVTGHGSDQLDERDINLSELRESLLKECEILKEYPPEPPHRPLPSCLMCSFYRNQTPIHSVWGFDSKTGSSLLITAYYPDSEIWEDCRTRRKQ